MSDYTELAKVVIGGVAASGPLTKLIEVVSAAIGKKYEPSQIVRVAEANAKAELIKDNTNNELAERARARLFQQEMQRQINIESVVENAATNLSDIVSDDPVDEDWRTRFFVKAQDVTSTDLQKVWGRILANEVNMPGSVSVRTLDILSNLSKQDAELFELISSLSDIYGTIFTLDNGLGPDFFDKYGLSYGALMALRDAGLLNSSDSLTITYRPQAMRDVIGVKITFKEAENDLFISNSQLTTYRFNQIKLSSAAIELLPILGKPVDTVYYNDFIDFVKSRGYQCHKLIYQ